MLNFIWSSPVSSVKYISLLGCVFLMSACGGGGKSSGKEGPPSAAATSTSMVAQSSSSSSKSVDAQSSSLSSTYHKSFLFLQEMPVERVILMVLDLRLGFSILTA